MSNRILIVEDEFVVANALRLALIAAGHLVLGTATSFEEATASLKAKRPDIVLLDIQLNGGRSGIDLAKELRILNIAFIYLSAYSGQQVLEDAKKTEPYGFLVKPFREKDLLAALEIANYRHQSNLDMVARQEKLLQDQLSVICARRLPGNQLLLQAAQALQAHLPFDLLLTESTSLSAAKYTGTGYLRTGFNEYQFISCDRILTASNRQSAGKSAVRDSIRDDNLNPDNKPLTPGLSPVSFEEKILDWFKLQSYLSFPVKLKNEVLVKYNFYSRHPRAYHDSHEVLLEKLRENFVEITAQLTGQADPELLAGLKTGPENLSVNLPNDRSGFTGIIGGHPLLLAALDLASKVAPYETSVLLFGESGTGKELVAQAIHKLSPRNAGPFVTVNCAAIPQALMESELFGHVRGAFTGAIEAKKGKFELADGGTLFLDEIGELPTDMQVKLLRVLQQREIEQVGGGPLRKIDVRIVAATNRNLEKEVAEGNFRLDLYYRLSVFPIMLPALRERKSDIPVLAAYLVKKICKRFKIKPVNIGEKMLSQMLQYKWPGNIRELENVIEQCIVLHDGKAGLELKRNLVDDIADAASPAGIGSLDDVKFIQRQTERDYIISHLEKAGGRIRGLNGAAALLNIKPTTLEAKMAKLGIQRKDFINRS